MYRVIFKQKVKCIVDIIFGQVYGEIFKVNNFILWEKIRRYLVLFLYFDLQMIKFSLENEYKYR